MRNLHRNAKESFSRIFGMTPSTRGRAFPSPRPPAEWGRRSSRPAPVAFPAAESPIPEGHPTESPGALPRFSEAHIFHAVGDRRESACRTVRVPLITPSERRRGGVVTQRTANPCTPVQVRPSPPSPFFIIRRDFRDPQSVRARRCVSHRTRPRRPVLRHSPAIQRTTGLRLHGLRASAGVGCRPRRRCVVPLPELPLK